MVRFNLNWQKAIEAIDLIATLKPGISQYHIGKILFFADKEHFLDYGRSITGDRYIAMEHGPVPSNTRDILKSDPDWPDDIISTFHERVIVKKDKNLQRIYSKNIAHTSLSGSDIEYIECSFNKYGNMSFAQLRELSHKDPAYNEAWDKGGVSNEMNVELWLDDDLAIEQANEYALVGI